MKKNNTADATKTKMYEQIREHGKNLIRIFDLPSDTDPIKLCKKLLTLEKKASYLTEEECNDGNIDNHAKLCDILTKVKKILFPNYAKMVELTPLYLAVFINGDPRGYALKIKSEYVSQNNIHIYRDWGGYGIIAPEFNGTNY